MRFPLLALLLVMPGLAAGAVTPGSPSWSPAAIATVTSSAMSADGGTIAVTLSATTVAPGQTPSTRDIAVLDFTGGARWNNSCVGPCGGKLDVAVSNNGDYLLVGGPAGSTALQLLRRNANTYSAPNGGWVASSTTPVFEVAMAGDARNVAALTGAAGGNASTLIQYTRDGTVKPAFPLAAEPAAYRAHQGRLHAVAVSDDGNWVAVGGVRMVGTAEQGVVYLLAAGSAEVRGVANLPKPVRSLSITRDGSALVAGMDDASFAYMQNIDTFGTLSLARPSAGAAVRDVALASDGSLAAVAHANGVSLFRPASGNLTRVWAANVTGGATSVAISADGRTITAASPGGGIGFASHAPTVLYTAGNGPTRALLSASGLRAAFTGTTSVDARIHAPAVALERVDQSGRVITPPPLPVNPGEPATFLVAVVNNGTAPDRGDLILPSGAVANRTAYETRPGDRWMASVTVTPSASTVPDTYSLVARAVSAVVSEERNITLQYVVGAKAGIALQYTGKTFFVVRPGAQIDLDLGVANLGNDGGSFRLSTSQAPSSGVSWNATVTPSGETYVNRQGSAPARLTVKVPLGVRDGSTNAIRLVALMGNVSSLPVDLSFIVNPVIAANITSDALGRLVTAGNAGWFNVTLKNTGSVEATYYVTYTLASSPNTVVWNVDVRGLGDQNLVTLAPGQARPIVVKLFGAQNAPPGSVGTVFLTVTDYKVEHGRVTITEWLNLSSTVVPRDLVPQTGNDLVLPGPAGVAVVATLALAVLFRRRSA